MTLDGNFNQKKVGIDTVALDTAVSNFLSSTPYHACLLLIHPEIAHLNNTVSYLKANYQWPTFSIGLSLSKALLPISSRQHARQTAPILSALAGEFEPGPLLCTEIDLLFEPSLSLDPLIILRQISRNIKLIVTWPGSYQDNVLAYAVPEHGHYRIWKTPDLCEYCIFSLL